jgi:hypothetical protein
MTKAWGDVVKQAAPRERGLPEDDERKEGGLLGAAKGGVRGR